MIAAPTLIALPIGTRWNLISPTQGAKRTLLTVSCTFLLAMHVCILGNEMDTILNLQVLFLPPNLSLRR